VRTCARVQPGSADASCRSSSVSACAVATRRAALSAIAAHSGVSAAVTAGRIIARARLGWRKRPWLGSGLPFPLVLVVEPVTRPPERRTPGVRAPEAVRQHCINRLAAVRL
jgi:hypothetical protein